jgi:glutamate dehydrogenase
MDDAGALPDNDVMSRLRTLTGDASPAARSFAAQALEDCETGELPDVAAEDLAGWLAGFWSFAQQREPGTAQLRLVHARKADGSPAKRDLLEIVQDDAPFLVDSVMGELTEAGYSVRAMHHPIVAVARGPEGRRTAEGETRPESFIQVVLDPVGEDRVQALLNGVRETLADVHAAVEDFPAMLELFRRTVEELEAGGSRGDTEAFEEELAFLRWAKADRFVFLGARVYAYPRTPDGGYAAEEPMFQPEGSLGVLRDSGRAVLRRTNEPAVLTPQIRARMLDASPLTVAKANLRSRVHRRSNMDYLGVRRYGADGQPAGEVRIVGLFTAEAYDQPTREVPLIRRKVANVMRRAGKAPDSHNEKRLRNILENYPRDELFQIGEDELLHIALGVLHLYDRPRVRVFARRDPFDRFVSVLVFIPRERYDSRVRQEAGRLLAEAYGGRVSAYYPSFSDAPLARVHFIIGVTPTAHLEPDLGAVEARIAEAARTWDDRFEEAVRGGAAAGSVGEILTRYAGAFPAGYRAAFDAEEALADLRVLESMGEDEPIRVRAYRFSTDPRTCFRFKLYRPGRAAGLSDVLPILEAMGLKAQVEEGNPVTRTVTDGRPAVIWVHEFVLDDPNGADLQFEDVKHPFEEAFTAVWTGRTENDGFNRLVLELGVSWREAALVRALARYRQQSGLDPSQTVQETALSAHPEVVRLILDLFQVKFDPRLELTLEERSARADEAFDRIVAALQDVASLDYDRVLRRLALLVRAIKRTNYHQSAPDGSPKSYISFKVASRELEDLPLPKPFREIFVWSPIVEGVHTRFGPVARGGLRWSDRRDDFRTEVLGLVKAQQVKNAVIVPVGAKGGFYPKALPKGGTPDETRSAAIEAYKTFLYGLLDVTDNLDAEGRIVRPPAVIAHEPDDPYLVVAADKGTASFSDIANGVSEAYGFWLGDAFASGGSAGYDHKVMGITARGAWEAVKRHFREVGKDIQSEPFTVMGVGDMSGDVFGNGMLLSKQIRLMAAFDHRDIFLDPDPDPARSFAERERLFKLPRSSWQDYDKALISTGGGVFSRQLKAVPLSTEVRAMLDLEAEELTPAELMRAILKGRCELLYLGGIGTYVKARSETDADAGDKANDPVRVNGDELRAQVIGEGANLGLTQAGRIAVARAGGRINTDAIDNSAGVDSSDHEVNIKILTGASERTGKLDRPSRNALLASMTDEVAAHVLAHNYDQTLALSLLEATAAADLDDQGRFMAELEAAGRLDRAVEGLPTAAALAELKAAGRGLTRPELAVLMAYGKLQLFDEIVQTAAPDDPAFEQTLVRYFPGPLAAFESEMQGHRLRREIIATVLANEMVNIAGPTFAPRVRSSAGADTEAVVVAFEAARRIFRLDELWDRVSALDLKAPAAAQTALYQELALVQRRQTFWLARKAAKDGAGVQGLVDAYRDAADTLRACGSGLLSPFERGVADERRASFIAAGAPEDLAGDVANLRPLTAATDVADLARAAGLPAMATARVYHEVGAALGLDRLRAAAGAVASGDHFERLAVRRLIEDLLVEQATLTQSVIRSASPNGVTEETAREAVAAWLRGRDGAVQGARRTLEEIGAAPGGWSFAKLTIANAAVRELTQAA